MSDQPPRVLCCWPGLAGLWLGGCWTSLLVAVGFSLILNLAVVSTFVWPVLPGSELKIFLWSAVLAVWLVAGRFSWRFISRYGKDPETPGEIDDTLFIQAQNEYLKGEFTQAELLLTQRLQAQSRDVEARLLLAGVFCRTGRAEKATRQLDVLQRLDDARRWQFEIGRLRQRIRQPVDLPAGDRETGDSLQEDPSRNDNPSRKQKAA